METITRKGMLYKTGVEYGDYTMNHVLGCSHGCKYPCYAFMMKKRFGEVATYGEWCKPKLVSNTLELLDKEIPRLKDKIKSVHLCFSTDPFPYGFCGGCLSQLNISTEVSEMSLAAIKKLNDAGIKCTVLTKGILPPALAELSKENEYGISLVSLNEEFRKKYEPFTAPYRERIDALKALHDVGCKTWVSMEPYPTPNITEQSLLKLLGHVAFVDKIVFGRWNYNRTVSGYPSHKAFYNRCAKTVKTFCRDNGIECRIKRGTITGGAEA